MAGVKLAEGGELFVQFVGASSTDSDSIKMYPTFAHLIATAAVLGARTGELEPAPEFSKRDSVDWDIFRRQDLEKLMLSLAISEREDARIVEDLDAVCRTVEDLSASGFVEMARLHQERDAGVDSMWPNTWREYLFELAEAR